MTTKPFQELLERLGRNPEDQLIVCYQSAEQGFRTKRTTVAHADLVVETLNDLQVNIWYEINPSNTNVRAKANDITRLSALWIDIDYKETGVQSPDNAYSLVELVSDLIGVAPTAVISSGHGLQPYWAIDPEEDFTQEMASGVLQRWGGFVRWVAESQGGQLDSVFDLPRIFRSPGSINFKHQDHPVLVTAEFPDNWRPLSLFEIDDVLIAHGFTSVATMPTGFEQVSQHSEWTFAEMDCHWAGHLIASLQPQQMPKSRHGWLLQQLIKLNAAHRHGCITESTANRCVSLISEQFQQFLKAAPAREMNPGEIRGANQWAIARVESFDDAKVAEELRSHQHTDLFSEGQSAEEILQALNAEGEKDWYTIYGTTFGKFGRTDASNAFRFILHTDNAFKHITGLGWFYWDGNRYILDENKTTWQAAIKSATFASNFSPSDEETKWLETSTNTDRIKAMLQIAETDPALQLASINIDANANDLCTPNGIVNLRTGELRPAVKNIDFNTRSTSVAPAKIDTPLWKGFLKDIIEDEDRINYIQELFGAALFGDSRYHVLPVFVGTGANGKSTILDVVRDILGEYAATMPEDFLIDTKGSAHPTDIARLRGVRFAMASETRPDGKFNESRVKTLTGGDVLSARFMGQNFFDFKPTHTLFMAVNHLPEVKSGGDGFWRRLRKIDFRKTIPVERRKENFASLMVAAEGPGILQWMIDGAVRITDRGMSEPESIKIATQSYRHEEDHIAKFLDEKTISADKASVSKIALYQAYRDWCEENGERPITQNQLGREIKNRTTATESKTAGFNIFSGIDLLKLTSNNNTTTIEELIEIVEDENWWNK